MKKEKQKKTSKNTKKVNKTRKCRFSNKTDIVKMLMEMLNMIKLYHWKTDSYAAHQATDELYEKLDAHIDKFVEVYLGKNNTRIKKWESKLTVIQYNRKRNFRSKMLEYIEIRQDNVI